MWGVCRLLVSETPALACLSNSGQTRVRATNMKTKQKHTCEIQVCVGSPPVVIPVVSLGLLRVVISEVMCIWLHIHSV